MNASDLPKITALLKERSILKQMTLLRDTQFTVSAGNLTVVTTDVVAGPMLAGRITQIEGALTGLGVTIDV